VITADTLRLRLRIAAQLLAGDCANAGPGQGMTAGDAVALADALIRANESYEAPVPGRASEAPVPPAVRERILDMGFELVQDRGDGETLRKVRQIYNSLRSACGVTTLEISKHLPF
jgi:hypothetical protein